MDNSQLLGMVMMGVGDGFGASTSDDGDDGGDDGVGDGGDGLGSKSEDPEERKVREKKSAAAQFSV